MASNYNRLSRPPVVLLTKDGSRLAVRRESLDDLNAIGNPHGVYTAEPKINYDVLKAVREAVDVPLVAEAVEAVLAVAM